MNRKGLTRGDGLVVVCVLLIFIFSFLPFYGVPADDSPRGRSYDSSGPDEDVMYNAWTLGFQPLAAALVLLPLISLVTLLAARYMTNQEHRPVLGLTMRQWSIGTSVAAGWCAVWSFGADYFGPLFDEAYSGSVDLGLQYGAYVMIPAILVLAFVNVVQDRVPGLAGPLAATPAQPYPGQYPGAFPGQVPPGGSYAGQPFVPQGPPPAPGTPAPGNPVPGTAVPGTAVPGTPAPGSPVPAPPAPAANPAADPASSPAPGPAPDASVPAQAAPGEGGAAFAQFWFAVPEPRDVTPVEGLDKTPVGTLQPGTWYLAVAEHGSGVVAEIDGRHGVLSDLSGIQRGES